MKKQIAWFSAKRFGYGSGLPIVWQGWVALSSYLATVVTLAFALNSYSPLLVFALVLPLTILFAFVASRRTEGGWRWRSGDED